MSARTSTRRASRRNRADRPSDQGPFIPTNHYIPSSTADMWRSARSRTAR